MSDRPRAQRMDDPKGFAAIVGEGVRRERQKRGWTQVRLAEAAGLSANYIARLERGELGPSFFVAYQLADTLGIAIGALFATPQRTTKRRVVAG